MLPCAMDKLEIDTVPPKKKYQEHLSESLFLADQNLLPGTMKLSSTSTFSQQLTTYICRRLQAPPKFD